MSLRSVTLGSFESFVGVHFPIVVTKISQGQFILYNKIFSRLLSACGFGPSEDGSPRRGYPPIWIGTPKKESSTNEPHEQTSVFIGTSFSCRARGSNSGNSDIAMTTTPSAHGFFLSAYVLCYLPTWALRDIFIFVAYYTWNHPLIKLSSKCRCFSRWHHTF